MPKDERPRRNSVVFTDTLEQILLPYTVYVDSPVPGSWITKGRCWMSVDKCGCGDGQSTIGELVENYQSGFVEKKLSGYLGG